MPEVHDNRVGPSNLVAPVRTAVLIAGCHLQAAGWKDVVWGNSDLGMGRLPQGLLAALQFNAEKILIGSGASRTLDSDTSGPGMTEAEQTIDYFLRHHAELSDFPEWRPLLNGATTGPDESLIRSLVARFEADTVSQCTHDELTSARQHCCRSGYGRLVIVTSPTHLPRAMRDAAEIFRGARCDQRRIELLGLPAQSGFPSVRPRDVVVLEPPHRPDRPQTNLLDPVRRLVTSDDVDARGRVLQELNTLLACQPRSSGG